MRVQSQYSVSFESAEQDALEIAGNAPRFFLKCRHVSGRMTADYIGEIRKSLDLNHTERR
jgi:hypothetical protein